MNGLIDIRQVATQILGFLILLWVMRKFAWGPLLGQLEARRQRIAGEFAEAAKRQAAADETRAQLEAQIRDIDTQKRIKIQEGVAEGQRVAAEMRAQAQKEAQARMHHAEDEIARELEKSKELLKERMIHLSLRGAEKVLRQKLDDPGQRKLVSEFIDEVGAMK